MLFLDSLNDLMRKYNLLYDSIQPLTKSVITLFFEVQAAMEQSRWQYEFTTPPVHYNLQPHEAQPFHLLRIMDQGKRRWNRAPSFTRTDRPFRDLTIGDLADDKLNYGMSTISIEPDKCFVINAGVCHVP